MAQNYDVVILGGGTGGYVAAIRAAQLGLKTAIVERERLGGTCLHKGCIPSKALLRSAEVYRMANKTASEYGVDIEGVTLQFDKVQARKQAIVEQLSQGVNTLMKKGKIDVYHGTGRILGPSIFSPMPGTISVEMSNGEENEMLVPTNVVIATGSKPRGMAGLTVDGQYVMNSDHALELDHLPKSLLIVGGGVIGIEWASMLCDFGVNVTVVEYGPTILPAEDADIVKEVTKQLEKRGVRIVTNARLEADTFKIENDNVFISAKVNDQEEIFDADKLLLCVGREANTQDIGLENTEIEVENGFIKVNDSYQTKESHMYAIGDVIGGLQLAHVASHEGLSAIEHIATGKTEHLNDLNVPKCVYSYPEVASIGLTEVAAKERGLSLKIGKFPFKAIGKALVNGEAEGFVKIIADEETDDILGIHMVGPHVTDLIGEASLAKLLDATPWEISQAIHPHPSLNEVLVESALAVDGRAIHF
ncbi:dihydrolipoyl dehydrogenase [Lysinibacillus fusiformis]|uniref:Dihydrolipoyl dehydrogenase n=1 Tax=Lysinibacillus fusiformis TaxID=28031 RepID=A0A1H9I4I4_9BACI|nr:MULTISPECIES: dihydrolipoyl dehydrogenase [Lysinibacillus]MED4670264.1 dihydrolipoyl dehydrogenase [Lysinibacillus fusiformis]QAS56524.1 dihydrolipoyl dehydrogenase [Lysinibacillus sphaericus]RDV30429.1 dihydrolipoyl dehydrogenase [Lysinibacillus fusiformis]SCX56007.1 dihydrolipoamide dehydrogenase [Lysinibacillus fusiformis]SCY39772.1 dihydrolipoamide dehydrogenase [Lysinibacillus fusiformis]